MRCDAGSGPREAILRYKKGMTQSITKRAGMINSHTIVDLGVDRSIAVINQLRRIPMDVLDPARSALVVVHMVKGVAGEADTPFNRLFRRRAEETGIIKAQLRLMGGFRRAKAKVVFTAVTYQPGLPGVSPNSPLWRTLFNCVCLMEGTPAVELMDELARRPDEPLVRGQAANGFARP